MDMTYPPHLQLYLLGRFQVTIEQRPIPPAAWRLRSAAAMVKLLALAPGYRLHREQLMDTLWPEATPETAANNLRYSLHTARRIVTAAGDAATFLQREGAFIVLGPPAQLWTDVAAFEMAVASAWHGDDPLPYQRAAALYVGELLPDELYEDWV